MSIYTTIEPEIIEENIDVITGYIHDPDYVDFNYYEEIDYNRLYNEVYPDSQPNEEKYL